MYSDILWYTVIYCDVQVIYIYCDIQVIYMPVLSLYALFHDVGNLPGQTCCLHLEPAAAAVSQGNQEWTWVCLTRDRLDVLKIVPCHQVLGGGWQGEEGEEGEKGGEESNYNDS